MVQKQSQGVLAVLLVGAVVLAACAWAAYAWLGLAVTGDKPEDSFTDILTNLAAVGSITAGFSLAAFAAVMSNTKAMSTLSRHYGAGLRTIVFLGQGLAVLTALVCALGSGMQDAAAMRWLAAISTGVLGAAVVTTVLLMNSMLGWQARERYLSSDV